jgi:hypothetical protein
VFGEDLGLLPNWTISLGLTIDLSVAPKATDFLDEDNNEIRHNFQEAVLKRDHWIYILSI